MVATKKRARARRPTTSVTTREATEAVRDVTHDFAETVEESVRARPLTTIAIAIGVGILFGMTLRR
jgi:ElaB/YqjD/DUF883 family membrane-anchored ribosome-binding protein